MKSQIKSLIFTLTFLTSTLFCSAQDDGKGTRFGFKFSPNFSWVKSNSTNLDGNGLGVGFSYGLMADFNLSDNYALSTELLVTSIRSKIKLTDDSLTYTNPDGFTDPPYDDVKMDYKLKYIQLPVSIKLKTDEIGSIKYWGQFGVSPSVLISSNVKVESSPGFVESDFFGANEDANDKLHFNEFEDNINFFRVSMILGAGIEYNISGNTSLVAGLRFDNSFIDMLNDKNREAVNNYLGIHLGVFF
jgi:long-subunit fatty acid transport protein